MSRPIESIAIIGGGFMGAGIAETAATAGIPVIVRELPEYLDATRLRLETSLDRALKRDKLDAADRDSALARITLTSELEDVASADLVIEAVPEKVELKASIMKMLERIVGGHSLREDIDDGMKLGAGHPMGPLTLCDFIGLDVRHAVCNSLYDEFKAHEYAPPPVMKRMIAAGRLGKKSGQGFYDYRPPAPALPTDGALDLLEMGVVTNGARPS